MTAPSRHAAWIAETIRAAGLAGITTADLERAFTAYATTQHAVRYNRSCNSALASATSRYPQVCEDDDGRLTWVEVPS